MTEFRVVEGEEAPSLSLSGVKVVTARESDDLYVLDVESTVPTTHCLKCGVVGERIAFGRLKQEVRDTPIHGKRVRLFLSRRRYRCKACGQTFLEPVPWMHEERRATKRLVEAVERDALTVPNSHVAHRYGVDEKTVKNVLDTLVRRLESEAKFETPVWLGIDEVHIVGKPRAVLTNIRQETLVEMLPDRNKPTIVAYLRSLEAEKVRAVTMDMWRPYRDAVREVLPHAVVVVDKFHVVRLANYAMEQVRKGYKANLNAKQRRKLAKDRFTLLKRRRDLTVFEAGEVERWKVEFPDLIRAYEAKETFFGIYDAPSAEGARKRYAAWLESIPAPLRTKGAPWYDLVTAMENWEPEIMAYFTHRLTNAYTESMNRIIRDLDRSGRGYSFPALRAKALYGQEFRKKGKVASVSRRSREAMDRTDFLTQFPDWLREPTYPEYGADIHRVAAYLKEVLEQHDDPSPPTGT